MMSMLRDLGVVDIRSQAPISAVITRRLVDYLISGRVSPGDRLPSERDLAEALGVGRSHVRQAIKSLTVLGMIEVRQGDGTFLKRTDSPLLPLAIEWSLRLGGKQSTELIEARWQLESVTARLAARHRSEEQLAEIQKHLEVMGRTRDDSEFIAEDVAFHMAITEAAGNNALLHMMRGIRSLLQVWIGRVAIVPGAQSGSWVEHAAIWNAIAKGDPIGAREAMEAHMAGAMDRLRETLPVRD